MYSNYGMAATSSGFQNSTNGSSYQTAPWYPASMSASQLSASMYPASISQSQLSAPMYPASMSALQLSALMYPASMSASQQLSGVYPACGSTQIYPAPTIAGLDTYKTAAARLPEEQHRPSCLYDSRRSYTSIFDGNHAKDFTNYSTGTEVNNVINNYSTGTTYGYNNAIGSIKDSVYGKSLMTSQSPSQLPIESWTNEEVLAAANLSAAEAVELLASVEAEIAAKRSYGDEAAGNGTISTSLNHSRDKSTSGSHRFGTCMQQSSSTNNHADTSSVQFGYERRVCQPTDINYLPSCQFFNQPNNNNNFSSFNRQTQDHLNGDIRTQSKESQHKMMPEYHLHGQHHRLNRTTTVYTPDTAFHSNFSKSSSQENYDFSQALDQGVGNSNFSQAFDQDVFNHNFTKEFSQCLSNQVTYSTQNGLQSCNEVIQPLSNLIPVSISNTQAVKRLGSCSATISAVHQAPAATSRKISSTARDAMMAWFEENKHHPYPDPDEYKSFVAVGGTTYSQAVKWFANRRKRTGTCKTIPEYVQGRREKPVKPAEGNKNVVGVNVNRKRRHLNDEDNAVGQPKVKKPRKM